MAGAARGYIFVMAAYTCWGLAPLVFKQLDHVWAGEIFLHRMTWTVATCFILLVVLGRLKNFVAEFAALPNKWVLAGSTFFLAANGIFFVYAIVSGQTLQASLGYFINPLISVVLGMVFLKERMNPLQWAAVALASVGLLAQVVIVGEVPFVALVLAFSFGIYGLLRKVAPLSSVEGLTMESLIMLPFMLIGFVWWGLSGTLTVTEWAFAPTQLILLSLGVVTAVPLILFARGARLIPLSHVGLCQYWNPTLQFLVAVLLFGEPFGVGHLVSFAAVWLGLGLFALDLWRRGRAVPVAI